MILLKKEKRDYVDAISKEIFRMPLKKITWENLNTLICSVISRCPLELGYEERDEIISFIKSIRKDYPQTKSYSWSD